MKLINNNSKGNIIQHSTAQHYSSVGVVGNSTHPTTSQKEHKQRGQTQRGEKQTERSDLMLGVHSE